MKMLRLISFCFVLISAIYAQDIDNTVKLDNEDIKYQYYVPDVLDSSLTPAENISILINYFIEKSFEDDIPLLPPKVDILRGDEERLDIYKQRVLKANARRVKMSQKYNKLLKYKKDNLAKIVNQSASKAFGIVYGKPILKDFSYNNKKNTLEATFTTTYKNIQEKVWLKMSEDEYEKIKDILKYSTSKVVLKYQNHKIDIKTIILSLRKKNYLGKIISPKFKTIEAKIVVNFSKYKRIY